MSERRRGEGFFNYEAKRRELQAQMDLLSIPYNAIIADVDIYERPAGSMNPNDDVYVFSVTGSATKGEGTAIIYQGEYFDLSKDYYAEVVLNRGSDAEIRGERKALLSGQFRIVDNNDGTTAMQGAVTDGAAKLRLQLIAKGSQAAYAGLMWKIVDPQLAGTDNFTVGRGTLLDGAGNPTEALPVTFNANGIAEAVYQAPDGFVRWGTPEEANDKERAERTIQPTVDLARYLLTGKDVFPPIRLKRPPVVLVHGLWGEPKVWDTFVNQLNRKEIYKIGRADYRTTNTEYLVENSQAIDAIIGEIIDNYVDEQFAVTKVDIVAHSMGGLVTREYCRQQALENNDCTRQIRKFITIGSPHSGSELANLVIDISQHPNSYLPFCRPLLSKLHGRGYRIWSDPANGIIAGAFIDLSTDSDAIQLLENNPTNLSWYAIVGQTSISSNVPGFKRRFAYDLRINFLWEGLYWACLTVPDASFYDLFGLLTRVFPEANDRIVSVSSQSKLSGKINRIADVDHYTVRNKSEVIDMIRTYLEVKGQ